MLAAVVEGGQYFEAVDEARPRQTKPCPTKARARTKKELAERKADGEQLAVLTGKSTTTARQNGECRISIEMISQ